MASRAVVIPMKKKSNPKRKHQPVTITREQFERLTVIQQIKRSLSPGARVAGITGLLIGGFIPAATYVLAHHEVSHA